MKNVIFLLVFLSTKAFCQDIPFKSDPEFIRENKIKRISVTLRSVSELSSLDGMEVSDIRFSENGDILMEKIFIISSEVIFSEEISNSYDEENRITSQTYRKVYYPEDQEDSLLLRKITPDLSGKRTFSYDNKGRLIKELIFAEEGSEKPLTEINYTYDNRDLKKQRTVIDVRNIENSIRKSRETFHYDKKKRLIKIMTYWQTGAEPGVVRTYEYDRAGKITAEVVNSFKKVREVKKTFINQTG